MELKGTDLRFDSWDSGEVRVVTLRGHDDEILGSLQMSKREATSTLLLVVVGPTTTNSTVITTFRR